MTHSMSSPSHILSSNFRVPSLESRFLATTVASGVKCSASTSRSSLGRSDISANSLARFATTHRLIAFAYPPGCPRSFSHAASSCNDSCNSGRLVGDGVIESGVFIHVLYGRLVGWAEQSEAHRSATRPITTDSERFILLLLIL